MKSCTAHVDFSDEPALTFAGTMISEGIKILGENVKSLRASRAESMVDFGKATGMSKESVLRLEKPGQHVVRLRTFRIMAERLGVTLDQLRNLLCPSPTGADVRTIVQGKSGNGTKGKPSSRPARNAGH